MKEVFKPRKARGFKAYTVPDPVQVVAKPLFRGTYSGRIKEVLGVLTIAAMVWTTVGHAQFIKADESTPIIVGDEVTPCEEFAEKGLCLPEVIAGEYNVEVVKYIDGEKANSTSANNSSFQFAWEADGKEVSADEGCSLDGPCALDPSNKYSLDPSEAGPGFNGGLEMAFYELTSGNNVVGESCEEGLPFALMGYKVGATLDEAEEADLDTSSKATFVLNSDMVVIIENHDCASEVPTPVTDPELHLIKYVCDSFEDINGNETGENYDHTNGKFVDFANYNVSGPPYFPSPYASEPVDPADASEISPNCDRASGWSFLLSTDQQQVLSPSNFGPTDVNGEINLMVNDLPQPLKYAFYNGEIWVSEVEKDGYDFATIRCYTDALNGDNLEVVRLGTDPVPQDTYCIAYNVANDDGGGGNGRFTLTVTLTGDGEGVVTSSEVDGLDCDSLPEEGIVCSKTYPSGTVVDLTATPHAGSNFDNSWAVGAGTCTGNSTPCQVTMSSNIALTAHFDLNNNNNSGGGGNGGGGRGNGGGGGGGNNNDNPPGQVLGDSTGSLPMPEGQVLGAATTLPVTGVSSNYFWLALFFAIIPMAALDRKFKLENK